MTDLQADELLETDPLNQMARWLELISDGTPPLNAGIECGWTPQQTAKLMRDSEVQQLIEMAHAVADGTMVKSMFDQGKRGNMTAIQTWLFNRRPDEWKDVKRVVVTGDLKVDTTTIVTAREIAHELLAEASVAELQAMVAHANRPAIEAAVHEDQ